MLYLWALLGPIVLTLPLSRWKWSSEAWWTVCVRACEHSGALLIKLAQWSSSRPDLFGEQVCSRFSHLQDNTTAHAWRHTEAALTREFGDDWPSRLRIDQDALLGSGCIAQVYKGELLGEDGAWKPVAIKVLHPGVRQLIARDMDLLMGAGRLLDRVPRLTWLNPSGMLFEFASLLLMQLDLNIEANNLESFRRHFPPESSAVSFPEPIRPYVTEDILVETFIEGEPFLQWARRADPPQATRARICADGVDAVIKMMFIDNFVHGDLHPGNIFVTPDEKLAFLDAGIVVRYSADEHEHLIDVLTAFIQYDGYTGGKLMAAKSALSGDGAQLRDLHGFCIKIQKMVEMARDEPSFFDKVGECISIICKAACDHRIKMQAGFISIALSVKVVEGSVLQVDPLCVVAPRAKAVVVREHMRRKGSRAILGNRSLETGHIKGSTEEDRSGDDRLILEARARVRQAGFQPSLPTPWPRPNSNHNLGPTRRLTRRSERSSFASRVS